MRKRLSPAATDMPAVERACRSGARDDTTMLRLQGPVSSLACTPDRLRASCRPFASSQPDIAWYILRALRECVTPLSKSRMPAAVAVLLWLACCRIVVDRADL